MTVLYIILVVLLVLMLIVKCFFLKEGNTQVLLHADTHTPFTVEKMTDDCLVLSSRTEFTNTGSQCATIVDCLLRTQLPYEQYDGIEAWGKIEREGTPREDDYFEATLIEGGEKLAVKIIVRLTARKGMDIRTALTHMVDLPMDIIYTQLGRRPWIMGKERIVLTSEEIARLAGVELAND